MPHLHPTSLDHLSGKRYDAEKEVFNHFKKLDDSWHVFHSATWCRGDTGECDFIIFNRDMGFIALEVKGGGISCEKGNWCSTDRDNIVHEIKDPARQALDSMYAVKEIFEDKHSRFTGTYCWGVCFPDIEWTENRYTMDLNGNNVLDNTSMKNVSSWVENLFKASGWNKGRQKMNAGAAVDFVNMLDGSIHVSFSIRKAVDEQEKVFKQINIVQEYLLDLFDDKKRAGFQGAAGTGKTWIAIKKAKRLAESGKQVLFLCYNRQVNNFIKEKLAHDKVDVSTFHAFALKIINSCLFGALKNEDCSADFFRCINEIFHFGLPGKAAEDRPKETGKRKQNLEQEIHDSIFLLNDLPDGMDYAGCLQMHGSKLPGEVLDILKLLLPGNKTGEQFYTDRIPFALWHIFENNEKTLSGYRYDAVIVDEGQDFHKNWCECLKYLFNNYKDRIFYIFYDDNQTIFKDKSELPVTELISSAGLEDHVFRLRDNLRNTMSIHDYAVNKTGLGTTARSINIPGLQPVEESFNDEKEAAEYAGNLIKELAEDHRIALKRIIVLSNRSFGNSIFAGNKNPGDYSVVPSGTGKRKNPARFRTIQQFKGLESDVVILVIHKREEDRAEERYLMDELMYVGYTRAKHLLYVVTVE